MNHDGVASSKFMVRNDCHGPREAYLFQSSCFSAQPAEFSDFCRQSLRIFLIQDDYRRFPNGERRCFRECEFELARGTFSDLADEKIHDLLKFIKESRVASKILQRGTDAPSYGVVANNRVIQMTLNVNQQNRKIFSEVLFSLLGTNF